MITKKDFDVFIAYHGTEDVGGSMNKAREIYEILTERGLNCFFNPVSNPDGAFVNTPIIARHCKLFLLVANPTIPVDQWGEITEDTPGLYNEVMGFYNLFFEKRGIRAGSARVYAYGGLSASQANNLHIVFNGTAHFEEKSGGMKRLLDWISASLSMAVGSSKPVSAKPVIKSTIELKCPNCGAKLERKSGKLVCYACDSEFSIEEDITTSRPKASVGEKPDIARLTDVSPVKPVSPVAFEKPIAEEKPAVRGEAKIDGGVYKSYIGNESSVTIPEGVTYIEDYAFIGNTDLKELTLPKSLKRIGVHAFSVCKNLCVINGGENLEHVMKSAFNECESLEDATFFSSLKEIGAQAFYGCKKLSRIVLPRALLKIGSSAFEGCERLSLYCEHGSKPIEYEENWNGARPVMWLGVKEEVKPVVKPVAKPTSTATEKPVTETARITKPATSTTTTATTVSGPLTKIFEQDGVQYNVKNGVLIACKGLESKTELIVPEGIEKINARIFSRVAVNLKKLILPRSLKVVESDAFTYCEKLERVEFLGCEKIGARVFLSCVALKEVIFNDGLLEIGESVFTYCDKIQRLFIPASVKKVDKTPFLMCKLTVYCEAPSMPRGWSSEWNKYDRPVVWGAKREDAEGVATITTTKATKPEPRATVFTTSSRAVTPKTGVIEHMGAKFTVQNGVLTKIEWMGAKLRELHFPEGITEMKYCMLLKDPQLKRVVLPEGLKEIKNDTFGFACSIEEIVLPNSLETVGDRAFLRCENVKEFIFGDNLTTLGTSVFTSCKNLEKVFLPKSLVNAGSNLFLTCPKLHVYCERTSQPTSWNAEWNKYKKPVTWGAKRPV